MVQPQPSGLEDHPTDRRDGKVTLQFSQTWRAAKSHKIRKKWSFFFRISSSGFNGHFRNRFIGGTYYIFLAYFSGLCKGISPQNMALYGTVITSNLGS